MSIPPNHYTSEEDEELVVAKYAEEIELGRLSHGYDPDTLFSIIVFAQFLLQSSTRAMVNAASL
jgi:hypothetical protein